MNDLHFLEKYLILGMVIMAIVVTTGYSFAYFTAKTTVNGSTNASSKTTTATLPKVVFDGGQNITNGTLLPGEKITKTFNVTFTPGSDVKTIKYNVVLNIATNNFVKCTAATKTINGYQNNCQENATELVYRLKRKIGTGTDTVLVNDTDITASVTGNKTYTETIPATNSAVTYYYTLEVEFKSLATNQLHNMNKTFSGTVDVQFTN